MAAERSWQFSGLLAASLAGCLLLALGCNRQQKIDQELDRELEPIAIGGELTLQAAQGPVTLASFRGHPVWLFFGYTSCPDACPTALAKLSRAKEALAPSGFDSMIETLFISLDPNRDTPAKLAEYLQFFDAHAVGATGTPEEVAAVAKSYGASYEVVPGSSPDRYLINHSTYIYLLDGIGRVRHLFKHDDSPERIAALTERLVRQACCNAPTRATTP